MFRIRRIYDNQIPVNRHAISQVQEIIRSQFPLIAERDIVKIPAQLENPLKYHFRSILFVLEDMHGNVQGFALLLHAPDMNFCLLELIATTRQKMGKGIGGTLYERIREEARSLGTVGIFMECLPDDPVLCPQPAILKENIARLRFYEKYGARPIVHTEYETPVKPGDTNPPYLVVDDLGQNQKLSRDRAQAIVRAILERKYSHLCPREYIDRVVQSFRDDPVQLREPRYPVAPVTRPEAPIPVDRRIVLVVNDQHAIHHVKESGYVEAPVRISAILKELDKTNLFNPTPVKNYSERYIRAVHAHDYVDYFKKVCASLGENRSVYPYVFPIRNAAHPPKELSVRAGYYCIDTFTPLNRNAFLAAKRAVDCGLTAAQAILNGSRLAYALVRPPGHHAERRAFGGFCYFNTVAIAAYYLSPYGRLAILDIDYHHGNGTQELFYRQPDVLTLSLHGHPNHAYPYFSGFRQEIGEDQGRGYNINIPLPEKFPAERYREILGRMLERIRRYRPTFLLVAFGADTAKDDPTGTWEWRARDFEAAGRLIGQAGFPTLVVQEGGYHVRSLGVNVRSFFDGLWAGAFGAKTERLPVRRDSTASLKGAKSSQVPARPDPNEKHGCR